MSEFKGKSLHGKRHFSRLQLSVLLLVITNVPMALYMSLFHQVSHFLCVYVSTSFLFLLFIGLFRAYLFYRLLLLFCYYFWLVFLSNILFLMLTCSYIAICTFRCDREELKMLCFICQEKPMMEELTVSSFSCLAIRHLITLAYTAAYLCAFWTVPPGIYPFILSSQVDIRFYVRCDTLCRKT
jgi:hypothetical protein